MGYICLIKLNQVNSHSTGFPGQQTTRLWIISYIHLFYSKSFDNYPFYNNPDVDKMLLEARSTIDNEERIAKYREIEKKVNY